MATWDDLTGTWDQLWTWDDPDRDMDLDRAYAMGEVTVDSGELTLDWVGDSPTDLLSPTQARDEFPANIVATDAFSRTVSSGLGADEQGLLYSTNGGSAADYSVTGTLASFSIGSLSVPRRAGLALSALNSDVTLTYGAGFIATGASGVAEQGFRTRFQDLSNYTELRVFRSVNTSTVRIQVGQVVAGAETTTAMGVLNVPLNTAVTVRFITRGSALYAYAAVLGQDLPTTPTASMTGITWLTPGTFEFYGTLNSSITNTLPAALTFDGLSITNWDLIQTSADHHPWAGGFSNSLQRITMSSSGYATFSPDAVNSVSYALVDDILEADFDITVKVRATSLFTGGRGTFVIIARWQDFGNYLRFRLDFNTDQIMGYGFESIALGSATILASGLHPELFHDVNKWIRFRVQGIGSLIRLKAWADGRTPPRDWTAYTQDNVFSTTAGKSGWGGYLLNTNTNSLPYVEFEVAEYWQGANSSVDAGQFSVGLSLDDGMPSAVTNTQNIGVNEASADLLGPIGIAPDIYYSTFRTDMPYADLPRDVAGVAITAQVLGSNGLRPVRVFTGKMADIPIDDQSAKLAAISSARLALSAPVQPPAVHGFYEGREATWLIGYILFVCGLYVAPRPLDGTRVYLPLNGTTHSYIPSTNYGAAPLTGLAYSALFSAAYKAPEWIDGPFTAAPDLCINGTDTRALRDGPGIFSYAGWGPGDPLFSKAGYRGRIEAWVRLDATNVAASKNPNQPNLFQVRFRNVSSSRAVTLMITPTRTLRVRLSDGTTTVDYTYGDLPVDGQWHFIAASWELGPSNPTVRIVYDSSSLLYGSLNLNSSLPAVDDIDRLEFDIVIPAVEIRISSGDTSHKAQFANVRPFSPDVIMRRSLLDLEAIAEPAPREGFEMLSALAQGELAQTGFDAWDRFLYLPLPFWAEPEQQRILEVLSTDSNLGRKFRPQRPVNNIFNQVSLTYSQTYVNENWVTGFQSSQLIRLDPGQTVDLIASMNPPIVEVRSTTLSVLSGSALAATPPSVTNAINYITMNTALDGTGTYATATDIGARISAWTPGAVTITLSNNSVNILYLANNVSIPPIGLGVKQAVSTDAQVTAINSSSIGVRNVRNLPVDMKVIQRADNAGAIAQALVGFLARPRTTATSDVWADFRRTPGDLVTIADVDNTGINTSFRLTGITTTQDGASVQQAIAAVEAWPVQNWGTGTWGKGIWGH
jgi:hypothetical protein